MDLTNKQIINAKNKLPSTQKQYKHVFIDLDDTLWDFHANARIVLNKIYNEQHLENHFNSFDEYFSIYAKRNLELWEQYGKGEITKEYLNVERFKHPMLQVGIDDYNLAVKTGIQFLDMLSTQAILIPYAKELLDYLYEKYPLTIVSNGFVEVQHKKMESANLDHYFDHIVLSEAAGALKPHKRIFEYALKLNGATASETIMIGDSFEADIKGAQNAGIDAFWYNPTNKEMGTHTSTPSITQIHNLKDILEIL